MEEIRTFRDIQDAVIARGKLENSAANRLALQEKINTSYQAVGSEKAYTWSGITYPLRLRAQYTTGTLTATNASDTLTGAGTAWTQFDHEGSKIHINGVSVPYTILRVGSTTSITMSAPFTGTTGALQSYTIFKDEYGLYPDCQEVRKFRIPGLPTRRQPIPCGPTEMDYHRSKYAFRAGTPQKYTMEGLNIYTEKTWATFNLNTDFWEDDFDDIPRNKNLIVWPGILTSDQIAFVRYTRLMPPMGADTDEPLISYEYRPRLVYQTLIDHFVTNRDPITKKMWEDENQKIKKQMAGDIEGTDEELILHVDHSGFSRESAYAGIEEIDTETT